MKKFFDKNLAELSSRANAQLGQLGLKRGEHSLTHAQSRAYRPALGTS